MSIHNNWKSLKSKLNNGSNNVNIKKRKSSDSSNDAIKRKKSDINDAVALNAGINTDKLHSENVIDSILNNKVSDSVKSKYIGLDCEMVGLGAEGKQSALARCCLVDFDGVKVYDEFVRPQGYVTDFRTKWSGIRRKDLRQDKAISFNDCQQQVAKLINGKILLGHALKNDLSVLMLKHSKSMMRDTAYYKPFMRPHEKKKGKFKSRSLKDLVKEFLKIDIQGGEHDPCEDARSAVMLYRYKMKEWEISLNEKQLEIKQKKWSNKSKKGENKPKVGGIKTGIFASDNSKNSVIKIQDI
jgi:RNA exonuclease 4